MKKNMNHKLLAVLMMRAAMMDDRNYYPTSQERDATIKCKMCQYFPKGTFCKLVRHRVCKETPAYKCNYFETKKEP